MHIKVFGPGCAKCVQAEKIVKEVVASRCCCGITVEKVSDLAEMMKYGIMSTPAGVVDDQVKITGRVPSKVEIEAWIDGQPQEEGGCCPIPSTPSRGGCGCGSGGCC